MSVQSPKMPTKISEDGHCNYVWEVHKELKPI